VSRWQFKTRLGGWVLRSITQQPVLPAPANRPVATINRHVLSAFFAPLHVFAVFASKNNPLYPRYLRSISAFTPHSARVHFPPGVARHSGKLVNSGIRPLARERQLSHLAGLLLHKRPARGAGRPASSPP